MARIYNTARPVSVRISRFLGLDEASGPGSLKLGASPDMRNFHITDEGYLRRRLGITYLPGFSGANIQRVWEVDLTGGGGARYAVAKTPTGTHVHTSGGSWVATTRTPSNFYVHNGSAYSFEGGASPRWGVWTLSGASPAFDSQAGYYPIVANATPPIGGGTLLEPLNLINSGWRQRFSGNASAKAFVCRLNLPTGYSLRVLVDGVQRLAGDATYPWTWNNGTKTLTFTGTAAPANLVDNVDIGATRDAGTTPELSDLHICTRSATFGGGTDSRIWLWGSTANPTRMHYCVLDEYGVVNPGYWPADYYLDFPEAVTDVICLYDRMVVFCGKRAFYVRYDVLTIGTASIVDFPALALNDSIGQLAVGQTLTIENSPVTIGENGIYKWVSTTIRDERNAIMISDAVRDTFGTGNPRSVSAIELPNRREAWFSVGNTDVLVWRYRENCWYRLRFLANVSGLFVVDGEPVISIGSKTYAFRTDGQHYDDLDGQVGPQAVTCFWTTDFIDFGTPLYEKILDAAFVESDANSSVTVGFYAQPQPQAVAGNGCSVFAGDMTYRTNVWAYGCHIRRLKMNLMDSSLSYASEIRGIEIVAHTTGASAR